MIQHIFLHALLGYPLADSLFYVSTVQCVQYIALCLICFPAPSALPSVTQSCVCKQDGYGQFVVIRKINTIICRVFMSDRINW